MPPPSYTDSAPVEPVSRAIFDATSDAIFIHARNGELVDVNQRACAMFGCDRATLLRADPDLLSLGRAPYSAQEARDKVQRALGEGPQTFEWQSRRLSGALFWTEVTLRATVMDEQQFIIASVRDISAQKEAQESLDASLRLLSESQRAANIGSYELDIATDIWRCSSVMDAVMGIGPSYPKTVDGWVALLHPEEREATRRYLLENVLGRHEPFDREYRIVTPGTQVMKWVHGLGRLIINAEGKPIRMVGTIQDITRRKLVEETLRESETRFRLLFDSMSEGMALHELIYDAHRQPVDYIVLDVNPAFVKHTGIPRDQIIGKRATDAYNMVAAPYLEEYAKVALTGHPISFEVYFTPLHRHFRISVLGPQPGRFVTIFEDITQRIRLEESRTRLINELNHRVKNNLATIIGLARQTADRCADQSSFFHLFNSQLLALAAGHDLLAQADWRNFDAHGAIARVLAGFTADPARTQVIGPTISLPPRLAPPLCLALHELATNAVKHGSWSNPLGCVQISWATPTGQQIILDWKEVQGPSLPSATPTLGYGLKLVKGLIEYEARGQVELHFPPQGFHCRITLPLEEQSNSDSNVQGQ